MFQQEEYDVIVVGAGHAGCEAAAAAANMGSKVLLVTMNMNTIAQMSCNPAMGGVAKGQIVREVDALGGQSGIITDKTMIQFRMLNRSKGPAMWSPRAQSDRMRFAEEWRLTLEQTLNVDFWQEAVTGLVVENDTVVGIKTQLGIEFRGKAVVLTNGTFLNGLIHIGEKNFGGGRAAEKGSTGITEQLKELGFEAGRMKTGTPPRVDGRSLDYSKMEEQPGDEVPSKFSYLDTPTLTKQRPCYITYTNPEVHAILKEGFEKSPMFQGRIKGLGPRYCPSVEDKINRFADKDRHQIFVEPEGWSTVEVYVNGFSSSLPEDVQYRALRKIVGFENAKMFRPGYAIEYDFFPPTQLHLTLETKQISNLYFAGQINGTTGYEEAACQGLMAGINAHNKVHGKEPFILKRSEAYIGVLIDDLVNKGTDEPYRMFTSRAEHRLLLRQDNADLRLTPLGYALGLASEARMELVREKERQTQEVVELLKTHGIEPQEINPWLQEIGSATIHEKTRAVNLLRRPNVELASLARVLPGLTLALAPYRPEALEQAEILVKYESYLEKEHQQAARVQELENFQIRGRLDYKAMPALSHEAREKLLKIQPETLGQASRISGVSPADVSVLMVYLGR
ncbi:tRNA uridine-5-carboxymethylaminomethyl(34) synthesis enzyme MnmG [Hymenobacter sp. HSC-4F20]|uniref:tRNA uridine-5-carboxymethylaminomethyl(34) synthesis enzyme MnmG n=1 Tax=Hymenobacter sp. HSC-4F20 TaxID=2864135 RepID=UPI001C72CE84|nr:tRNA uridine-5-carboxymethylaminomethyl(34) synthesis enzyme MnmG [Hymenobacter sp. HSC-4F20]MBX0291869.1 tRNA uridine-5-carboxymethylaminomethyl(34) synthesis enzyme MnmG [Hymenobacter sp. HSC-4F20]